MSNQPDIVVTDSGAPEGCVTVTVDGVPSFVAQENAAEFIRQEIADAQ